MQRFTYRMFIILFLFIPVFSTGALGNNKSVDVSSIIQVNDNLLTVKVKDIPLKKVLMEIAKQTPIKIVFYASAEENLVTDFSRLPMEKGLKKLLRDYNYTFTYGSEESKDGGHEIRKVIVLSNGGEGKNRKSEPMIVSTEEPSFEPLSVDQYGEEHMLEPFEESEPMIASTGGAALEPMGEVPYDEDMDIRDEEMEFDILRDELQDENAGARLSIVEVLGEIGGDKAIKALENAQEDEDEAVREKIAEELRRLKGEG